jgi:hypothetical protein
VTEKANMSGSLFTNDKGGNDKRPDYTGTAKIFNVAFRLSAWINQPTQPGKKKWLKILFEGPQDMKFFPKEEPKTPPTPVSAVISDSDFDDDIPF